MMKLISALLLAASLLAITQETTMAQTQTAPLPNGASALNETYQDWLVLCATQQQGRLCVMTQQQRKSDTGQLVLAAEFAEVTPGQIKGALTLPFGLRLAEGVTLQVDEAAAVQALPFATCLPVGCIVTVDFDAGMVAALRGGSVLKIQARAHDNGQPVLFTVSLKGFSAAQDRLVALARS